LKAPGFNPQRDFLVSKFAFKCNLYRYAEGKVLRERLTGLNRTLRAERERLTAKVGAVQADYRV
jgi:hypothetical protein